MAVPSGIAASVGWAAEVTYGTYVAPTRFLPGAFKPQKVTNTRQGSGVIAGEALARGARRVTTSTAGKGSLDLDVYNKSMGLLLQALMGTTVVPVQQGTTAAYIQTHTLSSDNTGKTLSMQAGVPDLGGTVLPYTLLGASVLSGELSCGIDEMLTLSLELDGQSVSEAQALVAPSYPAGIRPFHFAQSTVKVGPFGAETVVTGVRKIGVKVARPQDTGRFYHGSGGLKAAPVPNGMLEVTGTIEHDFVDKTIFADRYAAQTPFSLVWELSGAVISGTYSELFRVTLPQCYLDDDGTPNADGPDVVKSSYKLTALFDGTNMPKIEYQSTDVTL